MRRAAGALVLAVVLSVAGGSLAAGAAASGGGGSSRARAMAAYEWNQAGYLPIDQARQRLRFLRDQGFRTIYLEVGDYLEAADTPVGSPGRREELGRIRGQIRRFVNAATSLGLSVQALGGGPNWVGEGAYLGPLLVELVGSYNARVGPRERLQGVQLDIEPYVDPAWLATPQQSFGDYLATMDGIVRAYKQVLWRPGNRGLQLGFAIPFWFDGRAEPPAPGPVLFRRTTKPVAFHLIDLLRNLPGAYLVVMSYRVRTDTDNGSIALARDEFVYADRIGARCGLVVGQQYGETGEDGTSFIGQPREAFWEAAAQITRAFRRFPQFRGLSLDGVDAYMAAGP